MSKVTDPALLAELEGNSTKVTDPALLAELEGQPTPKPTLEQVLGPSDFTKAFASTPARMIKSGMQMVGAGDYVPEAVSRAAAEGDASTLGRIAGDIAGTGGIKAGAGALVNAVQRLNAAKGILPAVGRTAEAAGYGAAQGAITSPDEQANAAMWGAGGGAVGSVLGNTLARIRAGAKPTEKAMEFQSHALPPDYVPKLTAGQMAPKEGWLRKMEEGIADVPFVGAPLRARHGEALDLYQQASRVYANPNFGPIDTIADLKKAFRNAYEGVLQDKQVVFPTSAGPQQVPALSAHLHEMELKSAAGNLLKSPDPMHRMEGARQMEEAQRLGEQWRSQLPESDRETLARIDGAYANFVPIKEASKRQNATLVNPENYTPAMVLKQTRRTPNNPQAILARQAEESIGSIPARTTTAGNIGLGGVGLASLLTGTAPHAAVGAALAAAYGTKPGQMLARGAQRALTGEEAAYIARALRRGVAPAAIAAGNEE